MQEFNSLTVTVENTEIMLFHKNSGIMMHGEWNSGLHFHTLHEMFIVLDGRVQIESDKGATELMERDICIIPPRLFHSVTNLGGDVSDRIPLFFAYRKINTGADFDFFAVISALSARDMRPVKLHIDEWMLSSLLAVLSDSADGRLSPINEVKIKSIFSLLFLNIAEQLPPVDAGVRELYAKNKDYYMRVILMNHLTVTFTTVEELSGKLFLSSRQISNIFRTEYGMSMKQYKYIVRMRNAAKSLVDCPQHSIRSIAEEAGYASPEIFSILFKRYFGVSPTEYRRTDGR